MMLAKLDIEKIFPFYLCLNKRKNWESKCFNILSLSKKETVEEVEK